MTDTLIISIPDTVVAEFAVAAPERLPKDLERLAATLGTQMTVDLYPYLDVRPADVAPMPVLAHLLSCPDCGRGDQMLAERIASSDTYISVRCAQTPGWPPLHVPIAAAVAEAQADLTGGIVIDADNIVPLTSEYIPYPLEDPGDFVAGGWIRVTATPHNDGDLELRTTGLARLGLPELRVNDVPAPLGPPWSLVLEGLAQSLLTRLWEMLDTNPVHLWEIDAETTIAMAAIEAAVDTHHTHPAAKATVRLTRHTDELTILTVGPPDGATNTPAQPWLGEVVKQLNLPT